jgi:hypothetical protein
MSRYSTYTKPLGKVRVGDIVAGEAGGWWRIVKVHERRYDDVGLWLDLNAVDADTGARGRIYGYGTDWRTLRR